MAYYNDDELYRYFEKSIKEQSELRLSDLRREIDYQYQRAMKRLKEDLSLQQTVDYNRGLREIRVGYQNQINQIGVNYDEELIKKRLEMSDHVFQGVISKIKAFIKTKAYETYIKEKIEDTLNNVQKTSYIFKIAPKDQVIKKIIQALDSTYQIEEDESITYGGFILYLPKQRVEINETLDQKIDEQKDWFYKHSKLFIRE
ncbi:MAG: hypothetical protein AB7E61_07485 [Acholeplasmataceae bacterium]